MSPVEKHSAGSLPPNCPEVPDPIQLRVSGTIPTWLKGTMYRAGQGTFEIPIPDSTETHKLNHSFDGLAQIHRFQFDGSSQSVFYNSRDTAKGYEKRILARDKSIIFFGPDPCKTIFERFFTVAHVITGSKPNSSIHDDPSSENYNVTVTPNFPVPKSVGAGDANLVVKSDVNGLQVLDPITLVPKKLMNYGVFDPALLGDVSAAHHQEDTSTQEYINFTLNLGPNPHFTLFSINSSCEATLFQPISTNFGSKLPLVPSYIHAFNLTDRYIVLPQYPYYMSFNGLGVIWHGNLLEGLKWDGTRPTMLQVIDRATRQHIATFEADSYFAFHTLNAWDDGADIVFEVMAYLDASIVENSYRLGKETGKIEPDIYGNKPKTPVGEVRRYRLKDVAAVAQSQNSDSHYRAKAEYDVVGGDIELGRFNPLYERKKSRFAWGVSRNRSPPRQEDVRATNGLAKVDTETKELIRWSVPGTSAGEPLFVPNPESTQEDDGVLLSVVNSSTAELRCFMVMLDAKNMVELARADIGERISMGLHGSFVDAEGKNVSIN